MEAIEHAPLHSASWALRDPARERVAREFGWGQLSEYRAARSGFSPIHYCLRNSWRVGQLWTHGIWLTFRGLRWPKTWGQHHAPNEFSALRGLTWRVTAATSTSSTLTDNAPQTRLQSSPTVRNPGRATLGAQLSAETSQINAPRAVSEPAASNELPSAKRIAADIRCTLTRTDALRKRRRRNY